MFKGTKALFALAIYSGLVYGLWQLNTKYKKAELKYDLLKKREEKLEKIKQTEVEED